MDFILSHSSCPVLSFFLLTTCLALGTLTIASIVKGMINHITSLTTLLWGCWEMAFSCAIPKPCIQSLLLQFLGCHLGYAGEKWSRQLVLCLSSHVRVAWAPSHDSKTMLSSKKKIISKFYMFYTCQSKCDLPSRETMWPGPTQGK